MTTVTIIGVGASIFTAASTLPQLIKLIKEKKANDISLTMWVILFLGLSLWIWYGIKKEDFILIISNSFSLIINLAVIFFSLKFKN